MIEEIIDTSADSDASGLVINELIQKELKKTVKWTMFLSVLGFIGLGLIFIAALFMFGTMNSGYGGYGYGYMREQMQIMGLVYLIMAVVYFFPIYFLYQFTSKMKAALGFGGQMSLNEAFVYMRKQYQFVGIVAIVVISIYILLFLSAIAMVGRF